MSEKNFGRFLTEKIYFESQILALFDELSFIYPQNTTIFFALYIEFWPKPPLKKFHNRTDANAYIEVGYVHSFYKDLSITHGHLTLDICTTYSFINLNNCQLSDTVTSSKWMSSLPLKLRSIWYRIGMLGQVDFRLVSIKGPETKLYISLVLNKRIGGNFQAIYCMKKQYS